MGRDKQFPEECTDLIQKNAEATVLLVSLLLNDYCEYNRCATPGVRSGWRPAAVNEKIPGAAKNSRHMTAEAVDISDNDRNLSDWCLQNLYKLEEHGLYMESPEFTPTWCHLQIVPPKSGHRVFIP